MVAVGRAATFLDADHDIAERAYRWCIAWVTLAMLCVSLGWSVTSPAFFGPDETQHYNSVSRLVAGEGWPLPYEASIRGDTWQAVGESGTETAMEIRQDWQGLVVGESRSRMHESTALSDRDTDQMVQHPPGYYAVAAGAVEVFGGGDLPWDWALLIMRWVSAALVAMAVPAACGVGRRLTGSRLAGVIAGVSLLTVPYFANAGGYITNDSLLIATASYALYFAVRAAVSDRTPLRWLAAAGVALGLALLSKGLALLAVPVVFGFAVIAAWRRTRSWPRRLLMVTVPMVLAAVVGGWWWLRNLLLIGTIQPSVFGATPEPNGVFDYNWWYFVGVFFSRFNGLFWGRGVVQELGLPDSVVTLAGLIMVLATLVALLFGRRRLELALLMVFPLLVVATLFRNAHGIYVDFGLVGRGVQGRYAYGGIVAYGAVWASVAILCSRRRPQLLRWLAVGWAALATIVAAAAGWWVLSGLYPSSGMIGMLRDATAGLPTAMSVAGAIAVVAAMAIGALLVTLIRASGPDQQRRGTSSEV